MPNSIICDMHIHTKYSCDSDEEISSYCEKALADNIRCICFTDHIDFGKNDYGRGYYNAENFFEEFYSAKERYTGQVELLCGIEFAEPHRHPEEFAAYKKLPYDFILGSVHFWYQDMFPSEMVKANIPIELCSDMYWTEVLEAVKLGGFDSFAHFDFPKRYYGDIILNQPVIEKILIHMINNNICMEINTSSLRKGLSVTMPGRDILNMYKQLGGIYVTIASDAHKVSDLAADSQYAKKLADDLCLTEVIYKQRMRQVIQGGLRP